MAFTSVPQPFITPHTPTTDDLADLAHDLMLDEPSMGSFEAHTHAAELVDELEAYAASWDSWACAAGNAAAFLAVQFEHDQQVAAW